MSTPKESLDLDALLQNHFQKQQNEEISLKRTARYYEKTLNNIILESEINEWLENDEVGKDVDLVLNNIEDFAGDVDQSIVFCKRGGHSLLLDVLKASNTERKEKAAIILGSLVQNNLDAKLACHGYEIIDALLEVVRTEADQRMDWDDGIKYLLDNGGLEVLDNIKFQGIGLRRRVFDVLKEIAEYLTITQQDVRIIKRMLENAFLEDFLEDISREKLLLIEFKLDFPKILEIPMKDLRNYFQTKKSNPVDIVKPVVDKENTCPKVYVKIEESDDEIRVVPRKKARISMLESDDENNVEVNPEGKEKPKLELAETDDVLETLVS
ncbi:hypothetical protein ROZALSC1DRAFT_28501, partial [Rozella allomycis CSF55]